MVQKKNRVVEYKEHTYQDFIQARTTANTQEEIQRQRQELPIYAYKTQIIEAVRQNQVVILIGETGSGKTTQVPQYLYESGLLGMKRIGITQPRRVAAITISKRISEELGVQIGQEVGYLVRFDSKTNGMLLREALVDSFLLEYNILVLDEVHERSLQSDILCSFIKLLLEKRRDLKLILMSATLQTTLWTRFFPSAMILNIKGRQFPVDVLYIPFRIRYSSYTPTPEADYIDAALITILQIHLFAPPGDILVFLTGQEDIETLYTLIEERIPLLPPEKQNMTVFPLYAQLPPDQQLVVFVPLQDQHRKIILSTNIAESSITLNGIKYVVDSGLVKIRVEQGITGYDSLLIVPISKQQAWQRTGRAGRETSGVCYRLYTEDTFLSLSDQSVPEIQRSSLCSILLQILGIEDVFSFPYLESPSTKNIRSSLQTLLLLQALNSSNGDITEEGRLMAQFPLEPLYSKLILTSIKFHCVLEIVDLVSLLSVENLFYIPKDHKELAMKKKEPFVSIYGDHLTFLNILRQYRYFNTSIDSRECREVHEDPNWCKEHYINIRSMKLVMNIQKQLLEYLQKMHIEVTSCEQDLDAIRKCMVASMYIQLAQKMPQAVKGARSEYKTIIGSKIASIHPGSVLFMKTPQPDTIIYTDLVLTSKQYFRAVTAVETHWITELVPEWFQNQKIH